MLTIFGVLWLGGVLCYLGREAGRYAAGEWKRDETLGMHLVVAALWMALAIAGFVLALVDVIRDEVCARRVRKVVGR